MNKFKNICFVFVCFSISVFCFGKEDNLFVNKLDYNDVLGLNPNIIRSANNKIDWKIVTETWRQKLLCFDKAKRLNGYYGVFFKDGKVVFFTKLSKEDGSYKSNFISNGISADITLVSKDKDYFDINVEIRCNYKDVSKNIFFGFEGPFVFYNDILVLPSMNNNICFAVYRIDNL